MQKAENKDFDTADLHERTSPGDVVEFWTAAGPAMWFAKFPPFDLAFRRRFLAAYESAAAGVLDDWAASAEGALALLILLDQFPRNAFRGTARMYATDPQARVLADRAIAEGHDHAVDAALAVFFYLPFGHSESLADQDRAVALSRRLPAPMQDHAEGYRDIIRRFGRFPHRNAILGRSPTAQEIAFLQAGGFAG